MKKNRKQTPANPARKAPEASPAPSTASETGTAQQRTKNAADESPKWKGGGPKGEDE